MNMSSKAEKKKKNTSYYSIRAIKPNQTVDHDSIEQAHSGVPITSP